MIWIVVLILLLFLLGGGYAFLHLAWYIILAILLVYALAYFFGSGPRGGV